MTLSPMRERILDAAEARARAGGYNGFSFRDVAADVGVKSASVHHHFPKKADLMEALAKRYRESAAKALGAPPSRAAAAQAVAALFRGAMTRQNAMCLCGLLGAERDALPPAVVAETAAYFAMLRDVVADAPADGPPPRAPETLVAALEGGLILARTMADPEVYNRVEADALAGF